MATQKPVSKGVDGDVAGVSLVVAVFFSADGTPLIGPYGAAIPTSGSLF